MEYTLMAVLSELLWNDDIIQQRINLKDAFQLDDIINQLLSDELSHKEYMETESMISYVINEESWIHECDIIDAVNSQLTAVALKDPYDTLFIAFAGNWDNDHYMQFVEAITFLNRVVTNEQYSAITLVGRGIGGAIAKCTSFMCDDNIKDTITYTICMNEVNFDDVNLQDLITTINYSLGRKNTKLNQGSIKVGSNVIDMLNEDESITNILNECGKQSREVKKRIDELIRIKIEKQHLTKQEIEKVDIQLVLLAKQYIKKLEEEKELLKQKLDKYHSIYNLDKVTKNSINNYCDKINQRLEEIEQLVEIYNVNDANTIIDNIKEFKLKSKGNLTLNKKTKKDRDNKKEHHFNAITKLMNGLKK